MNALARRWVQCLLIAGVALCCASASCALLPSSARAEEGWQHNGPPLLQLLEEHAAELGLNQEELGKVRKIVSEAKARGQGYREQLLEQRRILENLLAVEAPDNAAVMRQVDVVSRIEAALFRERVKLLMELRSRFSAEQLANLGLRADAWLAQRGPNNCEEQKAPAPAPGSP